MCARHLGEGKGLPLARFSSSWPLANRRLGAEGAYISASTLDCIREWCLHHLCSFSRLIVRVLLNCTGCLLFSLTYLSTVFGAFSVTLNAAGYLIAGL